jgi:nitric oxide synthase oxygenase domain/subunit
MTFFPVTEPELTVTIEVDPPAERLRFKGQLMRYTAYDGQVSDYRVTKVSMPDEFGRCTLSTEPA